ncbi:MAG: hypothetical protein K0U41_06815 [Gammaproteobacteria bacterium]|nr:hypothetical protein [Gammaproteobacteria bacterium]
MTNILPLTEGNTVKYIFDAILASPKPVIIFVECTNDMVSPAFKSSTSHLMSHLSQQLKNFLTNYRKLLSNFYLQRLDIQVLEIPSQFSSMNYIHPSLAKPAAKNINIMDFSVIIKDCYPDEIRIMSFPRVLKTVASVTNFKNRNMVYLIEKGTLTDEALTAIKGYCQDKPNTFIIQFDNETEYE